MAEENETQTPPAAPGTTTTPQAEPPEGYLSQDEVNRIVEQRLARERAQYEQRLQQAGFQSFDEVAKLKKAQAEREHKELEEQQRYKELADKIRSEKDEEIRKRDEELNSIRARYLNTQAERSIVTSATRHEAIAPEQVAQLIRADIRIDDDGNAYVVDKQGNRRTDGKGGDLTVDAHIAQFLEKNPHFKRAAAGQGAGGRSGGTPSTTDTLDLARARRDVDYFLKHQDEIERRIKSGELTT